MPRADRDGAVLVPAERPVPVGRLVEEQRADGAGGRAEKAGYQATDRATGLKDVG